MHQHNHQHTSGPSNQRRLIWALGVTGIILLAEIIGLFVTGSLALLADAGHMLTDTIGLVLALVATILVKKKATSRFTWGFKRVEILVATAQATILFGVGIVAIIEGIGRLFHPAAIASSGVIVIGVVGLLGNVIAILILAGGRDNNLNMQAAFLEVLNDALGSIAVIISGVVIAFTGWLRADALAGIFVACLIMPRALKILNESIQILLESTPKDLDLEQVKTHLLGIPHVIDVYDLHAFTIAKDAPILSAHIVLNDECFADKHCLEILTELHTCVAEHHNVSIEHATFQLESESLAKSHAQNFHK